MGTARLSGLCHPRLLSEAKLFCVKSWRLGNTSMTSVPGFGKSAQITKQAQEWRWRRASVSCCTLRWFKTALMPFCFNWIKSHGFCDSQILHKVSATGSLIPPSKAPSSPLPGNLPFKFDMAGILIASQRHSDNFTTKQERGEFCFLLWLREQLFSPCPPGPSLGTRLGRPRT